MAMSSSGFFAVAKIRDACKSWFARVSQSRTSSVEASSIKFAAFREDLVKEGSPQMFVTVHLCARRNEHVLRKTDPAQTAMSALHSLDAAFVAGRHNDHQVNVAVFGRRTPSVRAKKPDLFGLKFRYESLRGCFKQVLVQRFHGFFLAQFGCE